MRYVSLSLIAALLFLPVACSPSKGVKASKPAMSKCQEQLELIPGVAAWLRSHDQQTAENDGRPLEGLEIVLTINHMVLSKIDPQANPDDWCYTEHTVENFRKIIAALKQNDMPPTVDFMVGETIEPDMQRAWLESGNQLGNMTYSRKKPKKSDTQDFIQDIERNDQTLSALWAKYPPKQKYFRFPGLTLSTDEQKLAQIRAYLKQKNYLEVPATVDAQDEAFSQSYCAALSRNDQACANFIKATFKSMLLDKILKARTLTRDRAGRDVKQILMIKANQLTCDTLADLLSSFKAMGARFISLDEALSDQFYAGGDVTALGNEIIEETVRAEENEKSE